MSLIEQLQVKRTEANTRLSSRKRKLSELFAATAYFGEVSNAAAKQQYHQQLQAFQDANDLQKGRRFRESTLPARPQIVRLQPDQKSKSNNVDTPQPIADVNRSKSPAKPNAPILSDTQDLLSRKADISATISPVRDEARKGLERLGVIGQQQEVQGKVLAEVDDGPALLREQSTRDSPVTQDIEQPTQPLQNGTNNPSLGNTVETVEKPDAVLHVPPVADRHSSPASTTRPGSHTPAPTAVSPNTSLGDEQPAPNARNVAPDMKVGNSSVPAPSATPDVEGPGSIQKASVSSIDVDMMDVDPTTELQSPVASAAPPPSVSQSSASRKPSIRINTETSRDSFNPHSIATPNFVETPAPITGPQTPRPNPPATPISALDSTKRATRISSGALQKKSVSEILGETPKSGSPFTESPGPSTNKDASSSNALGRLADKDRKEKERTKLSTVVFAKPQRPLDAEPVEVVSNGDLEKATPGDRDYLYTLFESKAYSSKSGNLSHLIQHSHKTITTNDHLVDYEYLAQCRVLKRLYQLQSADRWALRQRKRADEAPRPTAHWDFLLDHAKWMRTDFREERKWKYAAARALAEACADWVASSLDERRSLQVQIRSAHLRSKGKTGDSIMDDYAVESSHPTPDLIQSGEDESVADDIADPREISFSNAPAAIFSLGAGEFNFVADKTPAFDKVINELPLYEPAKIEPDLAKSNLGERLDARWKTDIVPVSRFATERLVVKEHKASVKRSRYDYELESSPPPNSQPLPPREENVGLFMPENKHIRDRIHPGHSFRPPSEHPMPTQSFFETRSSSQWTAVEDDELRKLVKDYSYNWSLISSCLTPRSLYSSSPDRRTPWECFERWIGLEGMPADMAKTPYFRTYSGRIEAAGRHIQAQLEEAQRRAGPTAPIVTRKRTTQPVRVERKRASRHLAMLDAMRKLAKKREVHRQKQAHSADMAAMRKTNEVNQPRLGAKTPAEWSQLKHEREQKLAKQQELYRQQLIAHQRAATAQQQRGTGGQVNGVANGMPHAGGNIRVPPNGAPVPGLPNGQQGVPNGISRPHPAMMGVPNGMQVPNGMGMPKGLPGQMQASMRNGIGTSPQQMRILNEAQKMHQEQLIRQAQQSGNHSSPNMTNASMVNGHGMNNPAFIAAMASANGAPSPSGMSGASGSPRNIMGQALSSGHVPVLAQIAANIKEKNPNMSDEDVQRHASQQLTLWQQQATAAAAGQQQRPRVNQAALNAAMGAANAAANAGIAAAAANGGFAQNMTNEQLQQYNQRLRLQQAQQHAARGMQGQLQANMMGQMTNSPVTNIPRPVSQHNNQGISRSATPRDQRAGSASNIPVTPGGNINANGSATPGQGQGQLQQASPRGNQTQPMQT